MAFSRIRTARLPARSPKPSHSTRLVEPDSGNHAEVTALSPRQTAILHLQQTQGNASVLRMLANGFRRGPQRDIGSPNADCPCAGDEDRSLPDISDIRQTERGQTIQRTLGDGHDLTSPRFAGDERLEACFDDEGRLTQGARGESVKKVQQALIDLGYDLGPKAADGAYGPMTWNAVKQFKAKERLGWETMGDVGPGTMGRLNELFPAPASDVDFGEENDEQSCPADDDIVTALAARPASLHALREASPASPITQPVSTPGAHVSIAEAVKRFKDKVNVAGVADPLNVSQKGQFFWGRQLGIAVEAEINRMAAEPSATAFVTKARAAFTTIMNFQDGTALINQLRTMAATTTSPEKPAMQALVRGHRLGGGALENVLWAALNKDPSNSLPNLAPFRSLPTLQSLRRFDKVGCGSHAFQIAQRLKQKGGITTRDPKAPPIGMNLVGGTLIRDRRPMGSPASTQEPAATAEVDPTSSLHFGDFFRQQGALSAVAQMQHALDAGQLIHARVMSGVGAGTDPNVPADRNAKRIQLGSAPPEEHSLLIIGYDGSQFVFHDPDAAVSHTPENGFGTLFYNFTDDRLSTAQTPAEMPVDAHGAHRRGDKRYQIISLTTI